MAGNLTGRSSANDWLYHPRFPEHWVIRPLYSLAQWVNGLAFRNIQFSASGKPVIKIAEIKGGISGQTKFTTQTFDESVRVHPGDLLFSWSGQPESSIDAFRWRGPEGWLNQHVFRVTPDNCVDPAFFFYLLRYLKPNFVAIARNKQTTGLGHVTKRDLNNMIVGVPSRTEQRAISDVLGTLDDKIELNRRMNGTLEAMARALFKSWFVDFDPVLTKMKGRDTGLPKRIEDLFPVRVVASERGAIPRGWKTYRLDELVDHHTTSMAPFAFPESQFEYYSIPAYDVAQTPVIEQGAAIKSNKTVVPPDAVLLSKLNPEIVRVWTTRRPNQRLQVCSTEFLAFTPREPASRTLLFCLFVDERFRAMIQSMVTGTSRSHQRISPKALKESKVLSGTPTIFRMFHRIVGPILREMTARRAESSTLAALRDALLPKLISGEMRPNFIERSNGSRSNRSNG